jgi:hypothetical protein
MSLDQVNQILGRALLDKGFRDQFLENPDQLLKGFDLTHQELDS